MIVRVLLRMALIVALALGFENIPTSTGPMGRNVEDLVLLMKVQPSWISNSLELVLGEDLCKVDSSMVPSIWNESLFSIYSSKKLKFGYYYDDGVTVASPPVKRAIEQTVQALKSQGHEVIEVTPPNVVEAVHIFVALTSQDGYPPSQPI